MSRARGGLERHENQGVVQGSSLRRLVRRAMDSWGWVLLVVALFILLPAGLMYLVSQAVNDPDPVRLVKKEPDILAPVNILSDDQ